MKGTNIREIIAEQTQVQRHKEALDSLIRRRAQDHGDCGAIFLNKNVPGSIGRKSFI